MADREEDQGITAYHGSPHDFEQFDLSKIGTGEGAQAYGHGLYFAESEPIAKSYRDTLSSNKFSYDKIQPDDEAIKKFSGQLADVERRMANFTDENGFISLDANSEDLEKYSAEKDKIKNMMVMDTINRNPHLQYGRMYEVSINAHPDHFLDWDKPLSEQSEHVRNAVINHAKLSGFEHYTPQGENAPVVLNKGISGDTAGHNLYKWFGNDNAEQASKMLNFYGIKGIKYLDAGSRNIRHPSTLDPQIDAYQKRLASGNLSEHEKYDMTATLNDLLAEREKAEKATRNYVVFDDKLVNVKRRYAQGGEVEREGLAIGGNPGDLAGGGFGTGNIGGGSSISSGGSMAEARAADRASVSGYSADSGGGSSWSGGGGGGGGRDSSPSIDRSTNGGSSSRDNGPGLGFGGAEIMSPLRGISNGVPMSFPDRSHEQMMRAMGIEGPADTSGLPTALRPGGNIGAALTKEALTPDINTANSPLASGVQSYDQNAINALYDRMREEQQAARDASYQRSVIGPVTKEINVPNAGDLYGATNAPLAVNQQPSGMFGQPEFGTTKFGEAPRQSGFPQMQSQTRSLEDVMGTKPQGEYLFSGMDISQRAVPNTYSVDPNSVISQVRKEWPTMTRGMNDQDIQNAILGGLPQGIGYKNGILTGNINDPALQATLQKGGVSMQTFKPVTETAATTQWGQPQAGPYRSVSMDGVAPQTFAGMYPVSAQTTPAETAADISRSVVGFPSMADKPLQVPSQAVKQTVRENFNSAFAEARSRGEKTFTWTNPATGQTSLYTTQLARKQGGRVPSFAEPDEWLAEKNESKKPERGAIAKRSGVLSSSKS